METIISSLITGGIAILVCLLNNASTRRKAEHEQATQMLQIQASFNQSIALIDCRLDNLTTEVREHNNFARRMPVIEEQIKVINNRIADLERHEEARRERSN